MSRTTSCVLFLIALLSMSPAAFGQAAPQPGGTAAPQKGAPAAAAAKDLTGTWRSAPDRTPLSGAFEESVWGKNAVSERRVELRVQQGGESVLTVTTRILDAKGRVVRGPTSIEESRLKIGGPSRTSAAGVDHEVTVTSAERRYPDDPPGKWPMEGLKVRLLTRDDRDTIEMRYDTPEGRGSFWETLSRTSGRTTTKTSPAPASSAP